MLRARIIDANNITDENATSPQVILGAIAVITIFSLCYAVFELHWTITFSICVASATSVSGILKGPFSGSQSD